MNFDPVFLFASLIPSGIGFVLFIYGKKQGRMPQLVAGLLFMVYPYFTPTVVTMTLGGVALGAALYGAIRLGW